MRDDLRALSEGLVPTDEREYRETHQTFRSSRSSSSGLPPRPASPSQEEIDDAWMTLITVGIKHFITTSSPTHRQRVAVILESGLRGLRR